MRTTSYPSSTERAQGRQTGGKQARRWMRESHSSSVWIGASDRLTTAPHPMQVIHTRSSVHPAVQFTASLVLQIEGVEGSEEGVGAGHLRSCGRAQCHRLDTVTPAPWRRRSCGSWSRRSRRSEPVASRGHTADPAASTRWTTRCSRFGRFHALEPAYVLWTHGTRCPTKMSEFPKFVGHRS